MRATPAGAAAALLAAALPLLGCGHARIAPPPNVVLVSIDTLRAGVLGCDGSPRGATPRLDAFSRGAVLFENALANSNNTLVSHMSMLTGLYPTAHRVGPGRPALAPFYTTLAEVLHARGYRTGFFAAHGDWLSARYGFDRGVDEFRSRYVQADTIDAWAVEWLRSVGRAPFFLFAHYYDVHSDFAAKGPLPYRAPEGWFGRFHEGYRGGFTGCDPAGKVCASAYLQRLNAERRVLPEEDRAYIRALYEEEACYTDAMVGKLLDELRRLGLYDRSLIVITADHGEEFQEHGTFLHGTVYDQVARVPLLVRFPGGARRGRVRALAEGVDLLPTILDVAGFPPPEGIQGESLLPEIRGKPRRKRFALIHTVALRSARWKAILRAGGLVSLYDLEVDPMEMRDVAAAHPDVLARMHTYHDDMRRRHEERYRALLEGAGLDGGGGKGGGVSAEERARLRALGYYGDAAKEKGGGDQEER